LPGIAECDRTSAVRSAPTVADTLGGMIREAREGRKLTQEGLGDLIGMTQQAVCGWERNRARPAVKTLADLAEALDLDLGDLVRAAGNPLEYPRGSAPPT
jgi:transcriptional regulator with XRE-family HTH domain